MGKQVAMILRLFCKKWKLYTDRIQAEINRSKGYKATASLADIVSESQLSNARKLVDKDILINSNFEMVDNQQIAPLGLKGFGKDSIKY
ncbi:hypothetical protein [Paenibacillus larvae]|uniref:hypothetical protein n=1 Tax=Paenibacillus larvae TaxID=1464 RepID=UPI002891C93A|nr:hypothetical protein [Paenibacillus larvae]MDT2193730.1 hypothetical protein [Paenibacillus larvae]